MTKSPGSLDIKRIQPALNKIKLYAESIVTWLETVQELADGNAAHELFCDLDPDCALEEQDGVGPFVVPAEEPQEEVDDAATGRLLRDTPPSPAQQTLELPVRDMQCAESAVTVCQVPRSQGQNRRRRRRNWDKFQTYKEREEALSPSSRIRESLRRRWELQLAERQLFEEDGSHLYDRILYGLSADGEDVSELVAKKPDSADAASTSSMQESEEEEDEEEDEEDKEEHDEEEEEEEDEMRPLAHLDSFTNSDGESEACLGSGCTVAAAVAAGAAPAEGVAAGAEPAEAAAAGVAAPDAAPAAPEGVEAADAAPAAPAGAAPVEAAAGAAAAAAAAADDLASSSHTAVSRLPVKPQTVEKLQDWFTRCPKACHECGRPAVEKDLHLHRDLDPYTLYEEDQLNVRYCLKCTWRHHLLNGALPEAQLCELLGLLLHNDKPDFWARSPLNLKGQAVGSYQQTSVPQAGSRPPTLPNFRRSLRRP
mmetsp:Transcript_29407/g.68471  ORF Transcript_29407/g.68471 Transcript_29407/m.68471 type:complete len:481 (+) Transcript_29407:112-1554(+)